MYKYYLAGDSSKSVANTWIDHFQTFLDQDFLNAPDVFTIQEESTLGSNVYTDVVVRINKAINLSTGQKLGDDFKLLLFQDVDHSSAIGGKYYFENNYWIVINTDTMKTLGASCMIRRCNNVLRWITPEGMQYSEPCSIDYEVSFPRDKPSKDNPVLPGGDINVYCQQNERTNLIHNNQRFLFGNSQNRVAYKVFGAGIRNFLNLQTEDDDSASFLMIRMGVDYVNETVDDVTNGIADRYATYNAFSASAVGNPYDIVVDPATSNILEGDTTSYNVQYYSGSVAVSGSFIFTVSGSLVPTDNYTFSVVDGNNFTVTNNERYFGDTLDILSSGSSGSRIINLNLRGDW